MSGTDSGPVGEPAPGTGRRTLRIDIVSDLVCPWCYIGKRRLEQALAARPQLAAEIHWLPYQLSPDMPREGRDRREHYATIFGAERAAQIMDSMVATAAAEGLHFQAGPGARSPNTLAAHALVLLAGALAEGGASVDPGALVERLFAAHHCHSEDIGDVAVLVRIAAEAGLDPGLVKSRLDSRADEPAVQAVIGRIQELGISGVPFFIIDGQYGVSGAQPPAALVELFDEILATPAGTAPAEA